MSTHQHIDRICVIILICTLLLTVLFINGESLGLQKVVDADAERNSDSVYFTANDLDGDWDASSPTATITLEGSTAKVSGQGAYVNGSTVTVTGAGRYVLTGSLTDGCILVDATRSSKVWLLLDGVSVTNLTGPALWVQNADKVFVTLAAGTENTLADGSAYSAEAIADGADGALFSHEDLTLNGSGSLTVTGSYKHGIAANDDLILAGGTVTVSAVADGVRANDSLRLRETALTVTAGDDGLVAANEEEDQGWLYVESGTLALTAGDDAIHTAGDVTIDDGDFTVNAGDDGIHSDTAVTLNGGALLLESCYEGVEALTIDMTGGDVTIYPRDDGFNANGGSGGFGMMGGGMGGRGGFTTDRQNTESGSESTTGESQEAAPDAAMEGSRPEMPADGSMPEGDAPLQLAQSAASATEDTWVRISGGTLTIINETGQDADGLDSNGSIYISGGDVRISLVNSGSNCAIDYGSESGGVCEITGGTVIACGSYSMAEGFDTSSTQASVLYNFSAGAQAGAAVALEDADGSALLSWEVPCTFSSVNLSCPAMTVGGTYQVVIGDQAETITLEETSASFGDAASSMFGGMNRMGQGGGMQQRGGFGGRDTQEETSSGDSAESAPQPPQGEPSEGQPAQGSFPGGDMPQGGPGQGGFGGGRGDMVLFALLENTQGVTLSQDGTLTVTPEGAQALLEALADSGQQVTATAEDLTACTTLEELMTALGMSMGGGRGGFDRGGGRGQGGFDRDQSASQGDAPQTPPDLNSQGIPSAPEDGSAPQPPDQSGAPTQGDRSQPQPDSDSPAHSREERSVSSASEDADPDARTPVWDLPGETWLALGLSAGVLLIGLFIALVFRRRGRG